MEIYTILIIAIVLLIITLLIGTLGFYLLFHMDFLHGFYNSVSIMTSNSIIHKFDNHSQLIFASLYALFSCIIFAGIIVFLIGFYLSKILYDNPIDDDFQ
jgi:hypothetical protein